MESVATISRSYTLLTAAYNEEACIEQTISSVLSQDLLPLVWVIVSDGCTDGTDEIVRRYAAKETLIRFIRREKDQNRGFASKVLALRTAYDSLSRNKPPFIGHLDADISLDTTYFRALLLEFEEDPALGIAGGWYAELSRGKFRLCPGNSEASVPGAIQMFRRECYEQCGGLLAIEYGGEDWYAEIVARMHGWHVRSFPELIVRHLRRSGTARSHLRYCYHQGFTDYAFGSHPLFEVAKVVRRITWRPYFVGAMARLAGFAVAHLFGNRILPPDVIMFLRQEQTRRILGNRFTKKRRALKAAIDPS